MNTTISAKREMQLNEILTNAYNDYNKFLSTRAFFKLSSPEVCKDLVQQTFMKTWIYLKRGGKIEKMKVFLYKILDNLIVDEYRKKKSTSLDTLLEKGFEPRVGGPKLLDILDGKEAVAQISELPEIYKNVVYMKYVQGFSLEEMSMKTGKPKNTLSVQLNRGLKKLRAVHSPA